jgi:hypothetical protein
VRKKEDNGGTNLAKAYAAKKMKCPDLMLASDAVPLFTLHVRPGAYHPISHRRLAREPVVMNREGGSSAAMVVDGGRRSQRKTDAEGQRRWAQRTGGWEYRFVLTLPPLIYPPR